MSSGLKESRCFSASMAVGACWDRYQPPVVPLLVRSTIPIRRDLTRSPESQAVASSFSHALQEGAPRIPALVDTLPACALRFGWATGRRHQHSMNAAAWTKPRTRPAAIFHFESPCRRWRHSWAMCPVSTRSGSRRPGPRSPKEKARQALSVLFVASFSFQRFLCFVRWHAGADAVPPQTGTASLQRPDPDPDSDSDPDARRLHPPPRFPVHVPSDTVPWSGHALEQKQRRSLSVDPFILPLATGALGLMRARAPARGAVRYDLAF